MNKERIKAILDAVDGLTLHIDGELGSLSNLADKVNLRVDDVLTKQPQLEEKARESNNSDTIGSLGTFDLQCDIVDTLLDGKQCKSQIPTMDVIINLLNHKRNKRVKDSTFRTYEKHLYRFEREFPWMPGKLSLILDYLAGFTGETGRYKRNQQDLLNMLYKHATRFFGMAKNPMLGLERPQVTETPIKTLSLQTVKLLNNTPQTLTERVALNMLLGHGWRQVEVRRILAGDVVDIHEGLMLCRGKERQEMAPILPETEERLKELAQGLTVTGQIFLSTRIYRGARQPLGEDGMSQMIARLYSRAGITEMTGHDLRRSFATIVTAASNDEFLAMRLLRDKVPGQSDRYIHFPLSRLAEALSRYSPLRIIEDKETGSGTVPEPADSLVETGESRTPRPREATQNILQA